jgi:ATP-binding cassette subfamily F protein uup
MGTILQAEKISKSYGTRVLFEDLDLNINEGDKIALIAPNGSGKSTLLRILAGIDSSDSGGKVKLLSRYSAAFLDQEPVLNNERTIFQEVYSSSDEITGAVAEYESALISMNESRVENAIQRMDSLNCWQYEQQIKQILTNLQLGDLNQKIGELSGGEKKRVALAKLIISESDLIIMDEPTNHLDLMITEYLEDYLKRSGSTLLMVTHDRYFLDRVCTQIIELDNGKLYTYKGNYSYFLEKRDERIESFNSETERARNLFRGELEWMRRMPQARATKAKYRINAFYELKSKAEQSVREQKIRIDVGSSRLGTKIINCLDVSHYFDEYCTIDNFTYNFARGEKIGLVGPNGVGKTTFLEVMTGSLQPSSGEIERGETLVFGYYRQCGLSFGENDTVIDVVREIAEVVTMSDGSTIPVTQFLTRFLFPHPTHNTKVEKLSGGERRRLYLVTVLMRNPNFLILDEPTNDLDIMSLNVLEEYLATFAGCVIIVSHDRYFLDKIADHIFVFEGDGMIKDFVGKYSEYRELQREREREQIMQERKVKDSISIVKPVNEPSTKRKLTYKEQRELELVEVDMDKLEKEKSSLEAALGSGALTNEELKKSSERYAEVMLQLSDREDRWIELTDI